MSFNFSLLDPYSGEDCQDWTVGWNGGNYRDIEVAPCRLKSLIIGSGGAIYSIGFSYYDDNGKQHKVGPWGGHGANKGIDHTVSVNVSLTY